MRSVLILGVFLTSFAFAAPLSVGTAAPEFKLKASDDKYYSLNEALKSGDAAVVVFVATKCPYSNAYNERFNKIVAELAKKRKKVTFLAINSNNTEPMDDVKKHATEKKFTFGVLKDDGNVVADAYGAEKTPEVFLVGKDGKVVYKGRIDDDSDGKNIKSQDLMVAVNEYLNGTEIKTKETKAFGCSIKRK